MARAGVLLARRLGPSQVNVFINMVQTEWGRKYVVLLVLNNRFSWEVPKRFLSTVNPSEPCSLTCSSTE